MLLTPKQRAAYVLRHRRGMSQAEIAAAMSISQPAVSYLLGRADARITALVGRLGGEVAASLISAELPAASAA